VRAEYGWAAPLTEQPDQEAPPEPELWYEVDEGAGELPWTGAAEAEAWAWKQPEESPFATPELLDVQDTEAADVAAWLEDEDEKVEEEDEETAAWEAEAWEAGTSAEAGAAGQGPGLGQVTVGVAELLQLWDTAAALDQRIRHMVRQTLLQRRARRAGHGTRGAGVGAGRGGVHAPPDLLPEGTPGRDRRGRRPGAPDRAAQAADPQ